MAKSMTILVLIALTILLSGCVSSKTENNASTQATVAQSGFAQIDKLETQISDKADKIDAIRDRVDRRSISLLALSTSALDELLQLNSDLQKNLGEFDSLISEEQEIISSMQQSDSDLSEKDTAQVNAWKDANTRFLTWSNYERLASQNNEKILSFLKLYVVALDDLEAADKEYANAIEKLDKRDRNGATNALAAAQNRLSSAEEKLITSNHAINFNFNNKIIESVKLTKQAYGEYILVLLPGKAESYDKANAYSSYTKHLKEADDALPTDKAIDEELYFWKRINIDSVYDRAADELGLAKKILRDLEDEN